MKTLFLVYFSCVSSVLCAESFHSVQTEAQAAAELNFLISPASSVGVTYVGSAGVLNGLNLPLSYYSTADYWGQYVGSIAGNDLTVVDVYNPGDYTLTPSPQSLGANLQIERVNAFNGTNIYDAACWQIALGVCGSAGMQGGSGQDLFAMAEAQNRLLTVGYDGNASQAQVGANRATTHEDGTFMYNGQPITSEGCSYFFRMVTRNWLSQDPFMGTKYMQYITAENLPSNPEYVAGKITWLDWKPITGENAWGLFIGPLQTAYLNQKTAGGKYVPYKSLAVRNALGVLIAIRCMQSPLGAIYYACKGSLGNMGDQPVNPYLVSVENNASALAGLMILQQVLRDELQYETTLSSEKKEYIQMAVSDIQVMIYGGQTPLGAQTKGLLSFFQNNAWNAKAKVFYQGGFANDPGQSSDWVPIATPKAVDVTTWGLSVLGQPLVDSWFSFGTCYNSWQQVKQWGGYFGPDGSLWGVGYSDQDGNGSSGNYKQGILSAEWTAGAINMVRCLITQYQTIAATSSDPQKKALATQYVQSLQKDHDSMFRYVMTLRSDVYPKMPAYGTVRPQNYSALIPMPPDKLSFVYANKRYMIPFGWFANPIPSTTSTSWILMLHYNFNPFKYGGDYTPYSF